MAIQVERTTVGGVQVATLTLDHPKVNVIDRAHCEQLAGELVRLRREDKVRAIVIRGAGRNFSTGVDIREHTLELMPGLLPAFHSVFHELLNARAVTIAAVHGFCLGGAAELALACDRVIAHTESQIGFPEIKVGCYPPVAIPLLTHRIGYGRAVGMILGGEPVPVGKLIAWGAVNCVTDDLDRAVTEELFVYAGKSPAVLGMAAELLHEQSRQAWGSQIDSLESTYLEELLPHPDATEGIAAFTEKRAPHWNDAPA